uniref:AzlC family ABC transporter permease n=1 Tax=Pararhizobium sp. IMCC3301 TaxID=3067904 RepID=UPI0027414605|nr:AzlC family ABC transporter permease [Pararhizobium sp. IMCC3301]
MTWYFRGMSGIVSVPAFILMMSYVGFGAFAREAGMTLPQAAFTTATVWALPSQVVLAGSLAAGTSIGLVALAVALASVRLTPMVAAWVPVVRGPASTRLSLVLMSQFVAITAWIVSMNRLPDLPREGRGAYFIGFASSLTVGNTIVTVASFILAGELSDAWRGALLFLTPIYFLTSLTAAARLPSDKLALLFGLIFGPLIYMTGVQLDLLWSGLLAGTLAFFIDRLIRNKAESA